MKKKLLTILITSLVMIGLLGGFLWNMGRISSRLSSEQEELLQEELDTKTSDKEVDSLDQSAVIPLYLSGDSKNVVTTEKKSIDDIYDPRKSAIVEEMLTDIKKKGEFTQEKPLWAYNPYGTNPDSLYLYFKSEGKCYCRYTISVDKDNIPDFTRTLSNGASGNVTEEHEYQLTGLVPGETNYIVLRLYNKKNELAKTLLYRVKMPESESGAAVLSVEKGRSREEFSNGLFTVFEKGADAILLYDNSGVLRGEFPVKNYTGRNLEFIYDNLVYAWAKDRITAVNSLGQVMNTYRLTGYEQTGDFAYDAGGNLYVLAKQNRSDTGSSKVLKIKMSTGEYSLALDMDELLPGVLKKAGKKKKARENWVALNSVQVTGANQILVSSETLSSIFKVSNVNTLMPKLDYIIADKKLWKDYKKLRRKVLDKEGEEAFDFQYGQTALHYEAGKNVQEEGEGIRYTLELLNNNTGNGAGQRRNSYYYRFVVDESAETCTLEEKRAAALNSSEGSYIRTGDNYLYAQGAKRKFSEIDEEGQIICTYETEKKILRAGKTDWKGFWFY